MERCRYCPVHNGAIRANRPRHASRPRSRLAVSPEKVVANVLICATPAWPITDEIVTIWPRFAFTIPGRNSFKSQKGAIAFVSSVLSSEHLGHVLGNGSRGQLQQWVAMDYARIVNEDCWRAKSVHNVSPNWFNIQRLRYVAIKSSDTWMLEARTNNVNRHHVCTAICQFSRKNCSQATRSTRYDDRLVFPSITVNIRERALKQRITKPSWELPMVRRHWFAVRPPSIKPGQTLKKESNKKGQKNDLQWPLQWREFYLELFALSYHFRFYCHNVEHAYTKICDRIKWWLHKRACNDIHVAFIEPFIWCILRKFAGTHIPLWRIVHFALHLTCSFEQDVFVQLVPIREVDPNRFGWLRERRAFLHLHLASLMHNESQFVLHKWTPCDTTLAFLVILHGA